MTTKKNFLFSGGLSVAAAAANMLSTVAIARFFGAEGYAAYIIDLAYISIFLVLLELFPSSFSVFKLQDDETYAAVLATFSVAMALAVSLLLALMNGLPGVAVFNDFSWWMIAYVFVFSLKRFLDIKYQGENRLKEYFAIELITAVLRVVLLVLCLPSDFASANVIWGSLVVASVLAQAGWLYRTPVDLIAFRQLSFGRAWACYRREFSGFRTYYLGIGLKRVKDNAVPLAVDHLFPSREAAGVFLLAFRGVTFACGLLRHLEAFLNNRKNLALIGRLGSGRMLLVPVLVPVLGQVAAIAASVLLSILGDIEIAYTAIFILSFYLYPYFGNIVLRARSYARYDSLLVSVSVLVSVLFLIAGVIVIQVWQLPAGSALPGVLVLAECAVLATFLFQPADGGRDDVKQAGS